MDIKSIIKRHGFKQVELAHKFKVTEGSLSQVINNPNISLTMLRKIADTIGADITEFFEDEVQSKAVCEDGQAFVCPHCGKPFKAHFSIEPASGKEAQS